MNRILGIILLCICFHTAQSQRVYFVYLQTDNQQPFYVKMNEKVYSSAASGYLVLSKLRDSVYAFSVGFPQSKWPEQRFSVDVKGKDHGYLIKNFNEKGWGLFDLQTMGVQMSATVQAGKTEMKDASAFTDVLSRAANDPSLRERPVTAKVEDKPVAVQALVKEEAPAKPATDSTKKQEIIVSGEGNTTPVKNADLKTQEVATEPVKTEPVKNTVAEKGGDDKIADPVPVKEEGKLALQPDQKQGSSIPPANSLPEENYKRSKVTRRSESSTTEGFGLTFVDEYADGAKDVINIVIPNPKRVFAASKVPAAATKEEAASKPSRTCSVASEAEFIKLRKKMAAGKDNDERIDEAKKLSKTKCLTTAQVKNLGNVFPDDAGRYLFYDASYATVADPENFPTLQSELSEAYFINRFKALLR